MSYAHLGPWAVIAGGSEGVGAAVARLLAADGVASVLVARNAEALEKTAQEVRALGADVRVVAQDLTAPDAVERLRTVTDELDVGLLVVNAGANTYGGEFVDGEPERLQRVVDLGITAPLALVHHYGGRLKERRRGAILLVGSTAGYVGQEQMAVYAAVKAFGRIFAEGLWLEMEPYGVHVLDLVLGVTRTPAMARAGLQLDLPGFAVAEPDDVAREGLDALEHGPVHVAAGNAKLVERLNREPRDRVVRGNAEVTRRLLGR